MTGQAHRERDQWFLCCAKCGEIFHQKKITHTKVVELLRAQPHLSYKPGITVLKKCTAALSVQLNKEALPIREEVSCWKAWLRDSMRLPAW